MSESVVEVIYEDDDVKLLHKRGQGDFLLITFGDLGTPANGDRFFADVPAAKLSLPCLGFMAKRANWFPASSVQSAIHAAADILDGFRSRLVYGGSMGGYAAIKYSAALGATEVLAMCPQWSLDRGECDGTDPGWQEFFEPRMTGMGIRKEDTAGRIFVLADTFDATDAFHASRIMSAVSEGWLIKVPFVAHFVTNVLAGTDNLAAFIDAARHADLDRMRRLARNLRKDSHHRISLLIGRGVERRPDLTMGLMWADRKAGGARADIYAEHYGSLMKWLVAKGDPDSAAELADAYCGQTRRLTEYFRRFMFAAMLLGREICLKDHKGRDVVFDLHHGGLHGRSGARDALKIAPILSLGGGGLVMEIQVSTLKGQIGPDEKGQFTYINVAEKSFAKVLSTTDGINIRYHSGFLSSTPKGTIVANCRRASTSEKFYLSLASRPAGSPGEP